MPSRIPVVIAVLLAVAQSAVPAAAQCLDWGHGFGLPGQGVDSEVLCFDDFDDGSGLALYVGGGFNQVGSLPIGDLARWDGRAWSSVPGGTFDQGVSAMIVHDDGSGPSLFVAGSFTQVGGVPIDHIAKWDGTEWTALGAGLNNYVLDLEVFDDGGGPALYACGGFSNAGASTVVHVAKWDGAVWSDLDGGVPQGGVNAMAVFDDGGGQQLFITGDFPAVGASGLNASRIAAWDGNSWSALGAGLQQGSPYGTSLAVYDDGGGPALYVAGQFNKAGAQTAVNIARWNGIGFSSVGGAPDDRVDCLAVFDPGTGPELYMGGEFSQIGIQPVHRVARWNGSSWAQLGAGIEWSSSQDILAMQSSNVGGEPRLWVGGDFDLAGGMPSKNIARWGDPCTAPIFHAHPESTTAAFGSPVVLAADVQATAPVTYQWRRDGVPVQNGPTTSGADTTTLTINAWSLSDAGDYELEATNSFGSATSDVATVDVPVNGVGLPVLVERVISPPETIPNSPTHTWSAAFNPVQSSTGDILFLGEVDGVQSGLGLWREDQANLLYREDDPAPFTEAGTTFLQFPAHNAATNGQALFQADLQGPSISALNREGVWYLDDSATDLVARGGNQAAGASAGIAYREFTASPRVSDSGQVVFAATAYQGAAYSFTGAWRWERSGGASLLARTATPAPGTAANYTGIAAPCVNPSGTVLFQGSLDTLTGFNYVGKDSGLWIGSPGNVQLIAKSGDLPPGMPAGTNLELFKENEYFINESGDAAFGVRVAGASEYIKNCVYEWSGSSLSPVVLPGDPAPGGPSGATFNVSTPRAFADTGNLVIHSHMQVPCFPCPNEGLWLAEAGNLEPIAFNESDPLPGVPQGFELQQFGEVALNDSDQVVLSGELHSGTGYPSVFGWTISSGLFPIAVPGTQLEISDGEYRTVNSAYLAAQDGGAEGLSSSSLTDDGTVVFGVQFTDGTGGIYRAHFTAFLAAHAGPTASYCTAGTSGSGCQALLSGAGLPSATANSGFTLTASDVEGSKDGLFFFGTSGQQANPWGNGTSFQCVVPPVSRAGLLTGSGTPNACDGLLEQDLNALWCPTCPKPAKNPGTGATVQAQLWYRDPLNTSNQTTSMSNAVQFFLGP